MTETHEHMYHKLIKKLIRAKKKEALRALLVDLNTVEIANALLQLKTKHQLEVVNQLNEKSAAAVLTYMHNTPPLEELTASMSSERLSEIAAAMPRDDAADLIAILDETVGDVVLEHLSTNERREIRTLMQYDEESAGGIMDPYVVAVPRELNVEQAIKSIKAYIVERGEIHHFYKVYVVDEYRHLVGSVGTNQLLLANPNASIDDLMDPDVVAVDVNLDQEEVARIAREYDLVVVPVIDKHLRLIGRVTIDDLVDVMSDEYAEDIAQFAGTGSEEVLEPSVMRTMRDRLPWLVLGLGGGLLVALLMNHFEGSLLALPQVTYFVPLIAALGGNIGIQSSSIVVRGLATGEIHTSDLVLRLWKEMRVGFFNGLVCAACLLLMAWFLTGNLRLGIATACALQIVVCMAAMIGASVPILLKRINVDPALATGPFITTGNDVVGVAIYLMIALKFS